MVSAQFKFAEFGFRMASPGHELLIAINASIALNSIVWTLIARSPAPILLFSAIDPQARPSRKPFILKAQRICCVAHILCCTAQIKQLRHGPSYFGAVDDARRRPIFHSGTKWRFSREFDSAPEARNPIRNGQRNCNGGIHDRIHLDRPGSLRSLRRHGSHQLYVRRALKRASGITLLRG